jgi:uncharacterized membrane protein
MLAWSALIAVNSRCGRCAAEPLVITYVVAVVVIVVFYFVYQITKNTEDDDEDKNGVKVNWGALLNVIIVYGTTLFTITRIYAITPTQLFLTIVRGQICFSW